MIRDRFTLFMGLGMILVSPLLFFYVWSLPDIPCSELSKHDQLECLQHPELVKEGKLIAAIFLSCFGWPYGVYYLYQRRKELKNTWRSYR